MAKTQCTFKVSDLLKLIGTQTTGNVLITETKTATGVSHKAQLTASAGAIMTAIDSPADGSGDGSIDGCPYPPGCN
ncbi:MAG: hypothetical protein V4539_06790 [Bacteroidota bacterium]